MNGPDIHREVLDNLEDGVLVVGLGGRIETRSLSVATSYLRRAGGSSSPEAVAAIAVFSDITELRELRDTELRLARAAEQQHRHLQDAYGSTKIRGVRCRQRPRRLHVQTPCSNTRWPFRSRTVSPFDPTDFGTSR